MLLGSRTLLEGYESVQYFWQYLGKYAFVKLSRHRNAYVSNKLPLNFPCAYLNTQESCTNGTPLIRIQGG
ncbi:hypothetical protein T06_6788 [Trichinella sp. T6]|nr:hypothetical protein T06_6788 [Trichinella sp. T6]